MLVFRWFVARPKVGDNESAKPFVAKGFTTIWLVSWRRHRGNLAHWTQAWASEERLSEKFRERVTFWSNKRSGRRRRTFSAAERRGSPMKERLVWRQICDIFGRRSSSETVFRPPNKVGEKRTVQRRRHRASASSETASQLPISVSFGVICRKRSKPLATNASLIRCEAKKKRQRIRETLAVFRWFVLRISETMVSLIREFADSVPYENLPWF